MFKQCKVLSVVLSASLLLSACADSSVSKQDIGTLSGGAIGGLLGSQFGGGDGKVASAVAGTLIGAFIGSSVGKSMDEVDKMKASQALETQPTGQTSTWKNPDNKSTYAVKPTKTVKNNQGIPCRYYTMTVIYEDGTKDVVHGEACREVVGQDHYQWKNVEK